MNPAFHAAIAAAAKRRQEQEEEKMTQYHSNDLNGWEFKIVRSTFGRFGNQEVVQRLVSEEAQNGWEMLEKFDNYRIRFKRRVESRSLHSVGGLDPYRTNYGASQALIPLVVLGVAALVAGVALFASKRGIDGSSLPPILIAGVVVLLLVGLAVLRKR